MNAEFEPSSAWAWGPPKTSLRLKTAYVLFTTMIGIRLAAPLLSFPWPEMAEKLYWISFYSLVGLLVLFIAAFLRFQYRPNEVAILAVFWILLLPAFIPCRAKDEAQAGLFAAAFRIHIWSINEYLSHCSLVRFTKGGAEHAVGLCEKFGDDWEPSRVVYDTTGELVSFCARTPEWIAAAWRLEPSDILTGSERQARHLFGDFYYIRLPSALRQ